MDAYIEVNPDTNLVERISTGGEDDNLTFPLIVDGEIVITVKVNEPLLAEGAMQEGIPEHTITATKGDEVYHYTTFGKFGIFDPFEVYHNVMAEKALVAVRNGSWTRT